MRFVALLFALAVACSADPDPVDAGEDASSGLDADLDGGVVACKALTCNAAQEFCKLTPVGPCTVVDAGACSAGEEACVVAGGSGCTPERTPSCETRDGCTNCPCLIAGEPCGAGPMSILCSGTGGVFTLECPYP